MAWHSLGKVNVTLNSAVVTGVGTAFVGNVRTANNVRPGEAFIGPDGRAYEIVGVSNDTSLRIEPPYKGPTASGQSYVIQPTGGYEKELAAAVRELTHAAGVKINSLGEWSFAPTPDSALTELQFTTIGKALARAKDAAAGRSALALGSAATRDLQSQQDDPTAGRVLFVNSFGLGPVPLGPSSIGDRRASGFYRLTPTSEGNALGASVAAVQFQYDTGSRAQLQMQVGSTTIRAAIAAMTSGGAFASAELFHTRNILGTVSQSAGVPTGAIIERGSNANGEYVRLADGTQICWVFKGYTWESRSQRGNVWITNETSIDLPASFVGNPQVYSATPSSSVWWCGAVPAGRGSISVRVISGSAESTTSSIVLNALCIGRWYQ